MRGSEPDTSGAGEGLLASSCKQDNKLSRSIKDGELLDDLSNINFSRRNLQHEFN
jgi:hypothetical protein